MFAAVIVSQQTDITSPIPSLSLTSLINPNANDLSIFDQIESPSNQIPQHLVQNSSEAQQLKKKRNNFYGGGDIDPQFCNYIIFSFLRSKCM